MVFFNMKTWFSFSCPFMLFSIWPRFDGMNQVFMSKQFQNSTIIIVFNIQFPSNTYFICAKAQNTVTTSRVVGMWVHVVFLLTCLRWHVVAFLLGLVVAPPNNQLCVYRASHSPCPFNCHNLCMDQVGKEFGTVCMNVLKIYTIYNIYIIEIVIWQIPNV